LVLLGEMSKSPAQKGLPSSKTSSDPLIDKLFPIPKDMRDTVEIDSVYWFDYLEGLKLGQVVMTWHMENGYRATLREPSGKCRALEECIPGMSGYEVRGIDHVNHEGWFVIDAVLKKTHAYEGITLGFGNELFWIEPQVEVRRKMP
jgi:hypothetical protein